MHESMHAASQPASQPAIFYMRHIHNIALLQYRVYNSTRHYISWQYIHYIASLQYRVYSSTCHYIIVLVCTPVGHEYA